MKTIKQQIENELKFDGLSEAEKLTGKSYKEDKLTEGLGFLNHIQHGNRMRNLMMATDDTLFSETESEYYRKVVEFGFKTLVKIPFFSTSSNQEERFYIMFHYDYSILLCWDTFLGNRNGGNFYYNWIPNDTNCKHDLTSSGGFVNHTKEFRTYTAWFNKDLTPHNLPEKLRKEEPEWGTSNKNWEEFKVLNEAFRNKMKEYKDDKDLIYLWAGHHDCREILKFNISRLAENGTFVKKWKNQSFIWLLHHMDTKQDGYSYEEINKQRIKMLPTDVQELIKGEF